jgi:hypothetical protein
MAYLAAGTIVAYRENPYDMTDQGGQRGVSRKLSLSTGEDVEVIAIPEEVIQDLGLDAAKLRQNGRPVVCRVRLGAYGREGGRAELSAKLTDIRFVRLSDLATYGYDVEVYDEAAEAASAGAAPPAPAKNGSKNLASV